MLAETKPRMNDVLQFGVCGEELAGFLDPEGGNRQFLEILEAEGYVEEYEKAVRADHHDETSRVEAITEVLEKVSARAQALVPATR